MRAYALDSLSHALTSTIQRRAWPGWSPRVAGKTGRSWHSNCPTRSRAAQVPTAVNCRACHQSMHGYGQAQLTREGQRLALSANFCAPAPPPCLSRRVATRARSRPDEPATPRLLGLRPTRYHEHDQPHSKLGLAPARCATRRWPRLWQACIFCRRSRCQVSIRILGLHIRRGACSGRPSRAGLTHGAKYRRICIAGSES